MAETDTPESAYDRRTIVLHWVTAALVVAPGDCPGHRPVSQGRAEDRRPLRHITLGLLLGSSGDAHPMGGPGGGEGCRPQTRVPWVISPKLYTSCCTWRSYKSSCWGFRTPGRAAIPSSACGKFRNSIRTSPTQAHHREPPRNFCERAADPGRCSRTRGPRSSLLPARSGTAKAAAIVKKSSFEVASPHSITKSRNRHLGNAPPI